HGITVSGLAIEDAAHADMTANYDITYAPFTAGVITRAPLTVTVLSASKEYDGLTASSEIPGAAPLISGDVVKTAIQTYDNKNVGTAHGITVSGLAIEDAAHADMT